MDISAVAKSSVIVRKAVRQMSGKRGTKIAQSMLDPGSAHTSNLSSGRKGKKGQSVSSKLADEVKTTDPLTTPSTAIMSFAEGFDFKLEDADALDKKQAPWIEEHLTDMGIRETDVKILDAQLRDFFVQFQQETAVDATRLSSYLTTLRNKLGDEQQSAMDKMNALQLLRSLSVSGLTRERSFLRALRQSTSGLSSCLQNFHSQANLIKETCVTLGFLALTLSKKNFRKSVAAIFAQIIGILPVHSIGFMGHICATLIVQKVKSGILIPIVLEGLKSISPASKSGCCELLTLMIETWPTAALVHHSAAMTDAIQRAAQDADERTRSTSRLTCLALVKRFPYSAARFREKMQRAQRSMMAREIRTLRDLESPSLVSTTTYAHVVPRYVPLPVAYIRSRLDSAAAQAVADVTAEADAAEAVEKARYWTAPQPDKQTYIETKKKNLMTIRIPAYTQSMPAVSQKKRKKEKSQTDTKTGSKGSVQKSRRRKRKGNQTRKSSHVKSVKSVKSIPSKDIHIELTAPSPFVPLCKRPRAISTVSELAVEKRADDVLVYELLQNPSGECMAVRQMGKDMHEIFRSLQSEDWKDRRDGLMSLHDELYRNLMLEKKDLNKLTDTVIKLLRDPFVTVNLQLLAVIIELIRGHRGDLSGWIPTILPALLCKLASVQPNSTQYNMTKKALRMIRRTFVRSEQMIALSGYIANMSSNASKKEKLALMMYLLGLINRMASLDSMVLTNISQVLARITEWTTDLSSNDVRQMARDVITSMHTMDKERLYTLMSQQTEDVRTKCDAIITEFVNSPESKNRYQLTVLDDAADVDLVETDTFGEKLGRKAQKAAKREKAEKKDADKLEKEKTEKGKKDDKLPTISPGGRQNNLLKSDFMTMILAKSLSKEFQGQQIKKELEAAAAKATAKAKRDDHEEKEEKRKEKTETEEDAERAKKKHKKKRDKKEKREKKRRVEKGDSRESSEVASPSVSHSAESKKSKKKHKKSKHKADD